MTGLRVTCVHDLRHSYATIRLYELHAPIQYVSEQLGYASIKIIIDIYGHPRQGTNTYLADRLDRGGTLTHHSATQTQPGGNMVA
jgi:integrase